MGFTHRSRLRSLRPSHLRITGSYSHIAWARRRPPLLQSRLAPRESSIPKGKPAGREGGGGRERTNLPHMAWTPKYGSVKTVRSPTPTSSPCKHLFQTKSEKHLPDMRSNGVESIYWVGTESGLMDIYNFPGVIYAMTTRKAVREWELLPTRYQRRRMLQGGWRYRRRLVR